MNKVLGKIIARKEKDLIEQKKKEPLQTLKKNISASRRSGFFTQKINNSVSYPAIIAEVKFASPSAGDIAMPSSLIERIKAYEASGADAVSVITEPHFFKGDIGFIKKVKESVGLPVLQKDFIIDKYQIYEAAGAGSDALLLIARLTGAQKLSQFADLCLELGIEPVVEVYSAEDLDKAVKTKASIIAVNSRDLDTFDVDVDKACSLIKKIPARFIRLGFSGIKSADEVLQYKKAGARGVLIGSSLMKAKNISQFFEGIKI